MGELWLALKLWHGWGKIKDGIRYLIAHPMTAVAIACALWGLYERGQHAHWVNVAGVTEKRLETAQGTITTMQATSKAEQARADAEHAAAALREKELNDAADRRVELARSADRAALGAYIERLRASIGAGQRAQVPPASQADVAQGSDGRSASAVMDVLSDDLRICTLNTRRLIELHNEALSQ